MLTEQPVEDADVRMEIKGGLGLGAPRGAKTFTKAAIDKETANGLGKLDGVCWLSFERVVSALFHSSTTPRALRLLTAIDRGV